MNGQSREKKDVEDGLDEAQVARYLKTHPHFFERHGELLEEMRIPHHAGTVSLIEHQVRVLQSKNRQLEDKLRDLVEVARDNQHWIGRLHRLALDLLEAEDVADIVALVEDSLRRELSQAEIALRLVPDVLTESKPSAGLSGTTLDERRFEALFQAGRAVCGRPRPEQVTHLFPSLHAQLRSIALIPLHEHRRLGVLALGSSDAGRFRRGVGTLFLTYLGELVSRALKEHLDRQAA